MIGLAHIAATALRAVLPDGEHLTHWTVAWIAPEYALDPDCVAAVWDTQVSRKLDTLQAGPDRVRVTINQARVAEVVGFLNEQIAPGLRGIVRPLEVPDLNGYLLLAAGAHVPAERLTDRDMLSGLLPTRVAA